MRQYVYIFFQLALAVWGGGGLSCKYMEGDFENLHTLKPTPFSVSVYV